MQKSSDAQDTYYRPNHGITKKWLRPDKPTWQQKCNSSNRAAIGAFFRKYETLSFKQKASDATKMHSRQTHGTTRKRTEHRNPHDISVIEQQSARFFREYESNAFVQNANKVRGYSCKPNILGIFCPSLGTEFRPHSQSLIDTFFPNNNTCLFYPNKQK